MKYVYMALSWLFVVIFLLAGLGTLSSTVFGGVCLIVCALMLLPPLRTFVASKTNVILPTKIRAIIMVALFVGFSVSTSMADKEAEQQIVAQQAEEKAKKVAEELKHNISFYNENRDSILEKAGEALSLKEYELAISQTEKYLPAKDEQLASINNEAKKAFKKQQKAEKTESLLTALKLLPATKYLENKGLYQKLVDLHPENEQYNNKLEHYTKKAEDEVEAQEVVAARNKQVTSQFNWDGSHLRLERFIKKSMHDPNSYEHVKTVYWDKGDHLIVQTNYRGKNAFGGLVLNFIKVKVDLHGNVIKVVDQT